MTPSVADLLSIFDVAPVDDHRYRGGSDPGVRDVIDGSQVLAQAIVAASKSSPGKSATTAHAVFCRAVHADQPIDFAVDLVHDGRTFTTAVVTAGHADRRCAIVTVLLDTPCADVLRHVLVPPATSPDAAIPLHMPLGGREIRLVGLTDPNDPDEVGPPEIAAWLRYEHVPERDDLARALLAHFTGHLSISTTMRAPTRASGPRWRTARCRRR